jgi:polar amino acid transport system substrate-binding protein
MKKIVSLALATLLLAASLFCFASCGEEDTLTVATNAKFPPFEYMEGNKFYGVDIEIMAALAARLDKKLIIKDMDFDAIVENVGAGYSDVAAAGLTVSPERAEIVTFSDAYYNASQMIIVMENDTRFDGLDLAGIETALSALANNTKAGVQNGTTGQLYLEGDEDWGFDGYSNLDVTGYQSAALAVQDMINGNLSLVVVDEGPAKLIVEEMNKTAAAGKRVKVINVALTVEEHAFAVAPGNTELLQEINAMLAEMKADGSFDAIINKYFAGEGEKVGYTGK